MLQGHVLHSKKGKFIPILMWEMEASPDWTGVLDGLCCSSARPPPGVDIFPISNLNTPLPLSDTTSGPSIQVYSVPQCATGGRGALQSAAVTPTAHHGQSRAAAPGAGRTRGSNPLPRRCGGSEGAGPPEGAVAAGAAWAP